MTPQVVTSDVRGTLLQRPEAVRALKQFTCNALLLRLYPDLRPDLCDERAIFDTRIEIEAALAADAHDGAGALGESLARLVRAVVRPNAISDAVIAAHAGALVAIERAQERLVSEIAASDAQETIPPLPASQRSRAKREQKKAVGAIQHRIADDAGLAGVDPDDPRAVMAAMGVMAAPLFAGFALWIAEQAVKARSERLYFFTREGQFFADVYEQVAGVFGDALPLPPHQVLSVSRFATFGPSLGELKPEHFGDLWAVYKAQSLRGLFATLGIEAHVDVADLRRFDLSLEQRLEGRADAARLGALLSDPAFRAKTGAALSRDRERLTRYLAAHGLDGTQQRVSTVDIGWRGSIQTNLARLLPDTHFHGLYLGLEKLNSVSANTTKAAYAVDLNVRRRDAELVSYVAPMEFLCGSRFGSAIGYSADAVPEPLRQIVDTDSAAAFETIVAPFQTAVVGAARRWAQNMRISGLTSDALRALAIEQWRDLVTRPNAHVARGFAQTLIDETFGTGKTFRPGHDARIAGYSGGLRDEGAVSLSAKVYDAVRSVPWPHAYAHYATDQGAARFVVPAVLRTMRRAKRLQDRFSK